MGKITERNGAPNGWHYSGDIDAHHGGLFGKVDRTCCTVEIVEITALWAATDNAEGRVLVESGSVWIDSRLRGRNAIRSGMQACGGSIRDLLEYPRERRAYELARWQWIYGMRDTDNSEVIACGHIGGKRSMINDGSPWQAESYTASERGLRVKVQRDWLS